MTCRHCFDTGKRLVGEYMTPSARFEFCDCSAGDALIEAGHLLLQPEHYYVYAEMPDGSQVFAQAVGPRLAQAGYRSYLEQGATYADIVRTDQKGEIEELVTGTLPQHKSWVAGDNFYVTELRWLA